MALIKLLANSIKGLDSKLEQAGIEKTNEEFIKSILLSSLFITLTIFFIFFGFSSLFKISLTSIILICIPLYFLVFMYLRKLPDLQIVKIKKQINQEIVFAGHFLIIEMQAGVPIYKALKACARNYKIIGKYFGEIVKKVDFGSSIDIALTEAITETPSPNLRKVLYQMLNSLKTGADIADSLNGIIDQITREQMIDVKEYGRKLNPLAMFYMIIAIILPSIGVIMLIIFSSFMSIKMSLVTLLAISGLIGFVQFMFYSLIKAQRPAVEI